MSVVPTEIDTSTQPPSAVPLLHFVIALAFLLSGGLMGLFVVLGWISVLGHIHLIMVGWVCVTIMGAMTQFVPVWEGVPLHSVILARLQLYIVSFGVALLSFIFITGWVSYTWIAATVLISGFLIFIYNIFRTFPSVNPLSLDTTMKHFLAALSYLSVVIILGGILSLDFRLGFMEPNIRLRVIQGHSVFAVFGVVVMTINGAVYQLSSMFTQTEIQGIWRFLQRTETYLYPFSVLLFGSGLILDIEPITRIGGLLLLVSLAAMGIVLASRFYKSSMFTMDSPMLSRYLVSLPFLFLWLAIALYRWSTQEVEVFAGNDASHFLLLGFIGFIVIGTLYHVVPFLIWVNRYSDRIGLEKIPMVDDLYVRWIEKLDLGLTTLGVSFFSISMYLESSVVATALTGVLIILGFLLFALNQLITVQRHQPNGVQGLIKSIKEI